MKKVVITGVSTGIGYSSAKILCQSGYFVYGSVRTQEDADGLSDKLGNNFQPLIFDVTDSKAIKTLGPSKLNAKIRIRYRENANTRAIRLSRCMASQNTSCKETNRKPVKKHTIPRKKPWGVPRYIENI